MHGMLRRNNIALFVITVLVLQAEAVTKVEVFYETHCPDSQYIMKNGIKKSLDMLSEVDFVLVPYGKASTSGSGTSLSFQCQHGEKECQGNTYHACAIELHANKKQMLEFAICTMSHRQNVLGKIEECANANGLDHSALKSCAEGQQGKELLAKMGELTKVAAKKINNGNRLDFVPSTLIDGEPRVYDAYNDLRKAICSYSKEKTSKC